MSLSVLKSKSLPLSQTHPHIAQEWHYNRNQGLTPDQLTAGSGTKVWWQCTRNSEHVWRKAIAARTAPSKRRGCPYCVNQRITPSLSNSLAVLFPQVAEEWCYDLNGQLTPAQVPPGANRKVWWRCPKGPDHLWQAFISMRTRAHQPSGCPCCSHKQLSVTNSLATRFPQITEEWHPSLNSPLTPQQVIAGTKQKVWWQCALNLEHVWAASVSNRTKTSGGSHCPYCSRGQIWATRRRKVANLPLPAPAPGR